MDIELGKTFSYKELRNLFKAVWGGVAWPGKRPGFAVIVGMDNKKHFDSHDVYLLDEFESFDTRQIVRQLAGFDKKYYITLSNSYSPKVPNRLIGDPKNNVASQFIQTMNQEFKQDSQDSQDSQPQLRLNSTLILEMERLYQFILPSIRELLNEERRQLFIKGSKIVHYLSEIIEDEISNFEIGEFPAIEALAISVLEMRDYVARQSERALRALRHRDNDPYQGWRSLTKRR